MLLSMTGYGAAAGQADGVEYAVEARSVNNRYLKAIIRLPEAWSRAEMDVEKVLRGHVQRGTVTLTVRMRLPEDQAAMKVNAAVVSGYLRQLRPLAEQFGSAAAVDLGAMLLLPGVCEAPELEEVRQRTRGRLMELVEQGLLALVETRRREGEALLADLLSNCDVIAKALESVKQLSPLVVREYQQRLAQRVGELLSGGSAKLDEDQLAREVAVFAERCDVAEEITRLGQHVEQFRQVAKKEPSAGRKLDFIAQEMLREANTIASKAASGDIVRTVVDIKTAIDRIKEQVQNVE
jgi:uncharacterized protein (TIGR00255 family)